MQHNPEQWESNFCRERRYYLFHQNKFKEQFPEFSTLCKYFFSILAHNANIEHGFSLMFSAQRY